MTGAMKRLEIARAIEEAYVPGTVITVFEDLAGWFVDGPERVGPLLSKERALDRAQGLVWAMKTLGEEAEVRIEPRSWGRPADLVARLRHSSPK